MVVIFDFTRLVWVLLIVKDYDLLTIRRSKCPMPIDRGFHKDLGVDRKIVRYHQQDSNSFEVHWYHAKPRLL